MAKIKTLRTVPGDGTMIPRGAVLTIGKDVKEVIAQGWLQSGYAAAHDEPAKPAKTKAEE